MLKNAKRKKGFKDSLNGRKGRRYATGAKFEG